jgi:1-acyl-sn-glycerol-3-phosphate acyltransferase
MPLFKPWAARPARFNGPVAELAHWISGAYLRLSGWQMQGDWPNLDKAVLVAAPHTSNWDGIMMLAAAAYYRVKLRWMGKKSLTQGPFGGLIKALGCVPIDRSASHELVKAMGQAFAATPHMILAIPPEGTRSLTRQWKTGFYHIAVQARVPIIVTVLDYGTKTINIAAIIHPSGDYDSDLIKIMSHYSNATGRHRLKFSAKD